MMFIDIIYPRNLKQRYHISHINIYPRNLKQRYPMMFIDINIYPRILIEISHVLSHIDIDQNEATPGPRLWAIHSTWNWSRRTVNPMEFDHRRKLLQP